MFVGRVLTHPITNNLFRKIDRVCHFHRRVCDSLEFISTRSSLPREPLFKRSLRTSCCFYEMATSRADDSASFRNRLSKEKSPYLLQHASNPVDWYPWGEEAFAKARVEDKLIFLSVGYSTCHWCHVMERESFEDPSIASIMNEFFVNIKVDREERPDVDKIYMSFVQASSGSGGWPMSVFLTPDLQPVAGGTYYPPKDQFGRPGFKTVLLNMAKQWTDQRQKVSSTGVRITELLRQTTTFDVNIAGALIAGEVPGREVWDLCSIQFQERYEPVYGGFSPTMKFPQPSNFSFLFHLMYKEASTDTGRLAQKMALHTLDRMADGGIHDHIAQGFARYSTDKKWHVPHFEKMLYDQAQLAVAYSTAYLATKDNKYAAVVRDILTYVSRDLSHKDGGFFSAEDADSHPDEGSSAKREGAFYVWEYDKVVELLNQPLTSKPDVKLHQVFCHYYHILPEGNVDPELDPHEELKNQNVLAVFGSLKKTSEKFHVKIEDLENELEHGRIILYNERRKRPKPQLDNKIITSWNGLMISGYARAASALGDKSYADRAVSAGQFIKKHLCTADNKLLRSCYTNGDTVEQISRPIPGFLDDYACLIRGLIDLYEATFDQEWLIWAEKLQSVQDELFWDHGLAGYFATSNDDSSLLLRMKEDMDGAEPSGNSVAAHNLLKLSTILDSADLKDKVEKLLSSFTSRLTRAPVVLPEMVSALMLYHDPPTQVVVTGNMENAETAELVTVARQRWLPGMVIMTTDNSPDNNYLCLKNQAVAKMKKLGDRQAAYVCHGRTCTLPVTTAGELADLLKTQ